MYFGDILIIIFDIIVLFSCLESGVLSIFPAADIETRVGCLICLI